MRTRVKSLGLRREVSRPGFITGAVSHQGDTRIKPGLGADRAPGQTSSLSVKTFWASGVAAVPPQCQQHFLAIRMRIGCWQ